MCESSKQIIEQFLRQEKFYKEKIGELRTILASDESRLEWLHKKLSEAQADESEIFANKNSMHLYGDFIESLFESSEDLYAKKLGQLVIEHSKKKNVLISKISALKSSTAKMIDISIARFDNMSEFLDVNSSNTTQDANLSNSIFENAALEFSTIASCPTQNISIAETTLDNNIAASKSELDNFFTNNFSNSSSDDIEYESIFEKPSADFSSDNESNSAEDYFKKLLDQDATEKSATSIFDQTNPEHELTFGIEESTETFATTSKPDYLNNINKDVENMYKSYIIGKISNDTLIDKNGNVLIDKGQSIKLETIIQAEKEGMLPELILNMALPEME